MFLVHGGAGESREKDTKKTGEACAVALVRTLFPKGFSAVLVDGCSG